MGQDLAGKVAIVTGGSEGIGFATAALLARRGAHVVILGRRQDVLDKARVDITAEGGKVEAVALDVTDFAAYAALIADVAKRLGRVDMLVNNAMSTHYAPIKDMTLDQWRKDFAVNADAVFVGTKAAMEVMAQQGGGSIVNIASTTAIRAMANYPAYSASKAALIQFSTCAAIEGARQNIRVNVVAPGMVNTAATLDFAKYAPELAARSADAIPMGRGGDPDELAEAIVFLLSDAASFITGVTLPVDGGKAMQLYMPS